MAEKFDEEEIRRLLTTASSCDVAVTTLFDMAEPMSPTALKHFESKLALASTMIRIATKLLDGADRLVSTSSTASEELADQVRRCNVPMRNVQRGLIIAFHHRGLSSAQIAALLGESLSAVSRVVSFNYRITEGPLVANKTAAALPPPAPSSIY